MKSIFLHHAGGDKYSWRRYAEALPASIEMINPEIPGRGDRFGEPLLSNMSDIVEDLYQQILPHIQQPYLLVGKSMGALKGYLLLQRLMNEGRRLPLHVYFGSRKAPGAYGNHPKIADKSSKDFWDGVSKYGGLPEALLQHEELKELYEPILRADFAALENYVYQEAPQIPVSATIMVGKNDQIKLEETKAWAEVFSGEVDFLELQGGHFFMHEQAFTISAMIAEKWTEIEAK